ncbi:hypothetical protein [Actinoallomurus sp. NPDC050550]|uniref:hypothetical protein n=1 Tax=Actinoallomurus sp. NPDC050550 TaxID=3154937 RepID=UPI00340D29DA
MSRVTARWSDGAAVAASARADGEARLSSAASGVEIEEIGGHFLIKPTGEEAGEYAGLLADLASHDDATVVVVAVPERLADALWPRLAEVRTRSQRRRIVLAMAGAGADRADAPALGRRIADAWKVTVVAPAGEVVLVPGGTAFTYADASGTGPEPQWWSFAPEIEPKALGPRWPVPEWHQVLADALTSVDAKGPAALTHVPAGVLVRPAGSPASGPGDLPYAVPPVRDRPSVLVESTQRPWFAPVDLAAVLAGLISSAVWRWYPIRLVPSGDGDLLPLGEALARALGAEVEVFTGIPAELTGASSRDSEAPAGRGVVLVDAQRLPTWSPFVPSVLCRPPSRGAIAPPPVPQHWQAPVDGLEVVDPVRGVLRLAGPCRLAVTRAGLWLYPVDAAPEPFSDRLAVAWPVMADTVRLDIGLSGRLLGDETWPVLGGLLGALPPGLRDRLVLVLHGTVTQQGDRAMRDLAAAHNVRIEGDPSASSASALPAVSTSTATPSSTSPPLRAADSGHASTATPSLGSPPTRARAGRMPRTATASVTPTHRSTDEERSAFRAMIGLAWDSQAAPLRRAFSRLPAIAAGERAAAAVDLVAVRLFLTEGQTDRAGDFGAAALRSGDERLRPYLACLASGLWRLPTYRGVVLRGVDASVLEREVLSPGTTVLTEPGPVAGSSLRRGTPNRAGKHARPSATASYVIWSETGRWVTALLDADPAGGPTDTTADGSATLIGTDDVVFAPGSRFVVLDVRLGGIEAPELILLRELPATVAPTGSAIEPSSGERNALTRLDEALGEFLTDGGAPSWPTAALEPIGET